MALSQQQLDQFRRDLPNLPIEFTVFKQQMTFKVDMIINWLWNHKIDSTYENVAQCQKGVQFYFEFLMTQQLGAKK